MRNEAMSCAECYAQLSEQFDAFPNLTYCEHRSPGFKLYDQSWAEMQEYVGRRCAVVLDNFEGLVSQVGVLILVDPEGDAVVIDDEGVRHFCWPVLEVRPAATLEIGGYFSRCSACHGNADPGDQRHLHGGPGSGYRVGSALSDTNGCGAIFVKRTYVYARGLDGTDTGTG